MDLGVDESGAVITLEWMQRQPVDERIRAPFRVVSHQSVIIDFVNRRLLPTFIVIGAAKAGTTSFASYLNQHPDIFMTDPKEPGHFTGKGKFADADRYSDLFEGGTRHRARGEASTVYSRQNSFPGVPERMWSVVPDVRIVYVTRSRLDRLQSHYLMRLRMGSTGGTFEEFVTRTDWYVDISCYATQIEAYLQYFTPEQIFVTRLEDIGSEPSVVLQQAARHIRVDPEFFQGFSNPERLNTAPPGRPERFFRIPPIVRRMGNALPRDIRHLLKRQLPQTEIGLDELELSEATRERLRSRFDDDERRLQSLFDQTELQRS